jgi:putative heme-binding domain-containing protein
MPLIPFHPNRPSRLARVLGVWLLGALLCPGFFPSILSASTNSFPVPIPDWKIELVAQAPDLSHPSVVTCAPDGRVFVAEDPMDIRSPADSTNGRILCIHPDGRRTVFADQLHAVFGMQYLAGRLYVLHNPNFSSFRDSNGIGTDRRELIAQTNPNPWALDWNDHVPANFRLGMDGYFYIAVGDKGLFGAEGTDGRKLDLQGGGIVRIRPDGSGLEAFSTGVRNILDVALTDEDDLFTYDNTDENQWMGRLTHMVDGGFYGYPFDFIPRRPYTLWMMADYGAGAATGALAITGDALPPDYLGNLLLADFGQRNIRRVQLTRESGTFRPVSDQLLFQHTPGDFRPVGIAFNDDHSALYICDWQHRDTREEAVAGRLWKLSWTGTNRAQPRPAWYRHAALGQEVEVPVPELVGNLDHPSHQVRLATQRLLSSRGPDVIDPLSQAIGSDTLSPRTRIHALWALHAVNRAVLSSTVVARAAQSSNLALARQAIRQIGESANQSHLPLVRSLLDSPDDSIRLHAATALGRIGSPVAIPDLLQALQQTNLFVHHAAFTALRRIGAAHPDSWNRIVPGLASSNPSVASGTLFALRDQFDSRLVDVLTAIVTNHAQPLPFRTNALLALAPLHHKPPTWNGQWWAYHPFRLAPPARTNAWPGTTNIAHALSTVLSADQAPIRLLAARGFGQLPRELVGSRLLARFPSESDPDVRDALITAIGRLRPTGASPMAARFLLQSPSTLPYDEAAVRLARAVGGPAVVRALILATRRRSDSAQTQQAIGLLGELGEPSAVSELAPIARLDPSPLQIPAIEALGRIGDSNATQALVDLLPSPPIPRQSAILKAITPLRQTNAIPAILHAAAVPELRASATAALLLMPDRRALDLYVERLGSRQPFARAEARQALRRIRDEVLPQLAPRFTNLPPETLAELQQVYRAHPGAMAAGLFAIATPRPTPEAYLAHALANPGDPTRGRALFHDASGVACISCHRVQGSGATIGPDLSGAGAQFDRRTLAESILFPNRAVREGYNLVVLELNDGDEASGMIRAETTDAITLQPAAGDPVVIPKDRIRNRRQTSQSLMPEGLEGSLSPEEFSDLVSYLESLRSGT